MVSRISKQSYYFISFRVRTPKKGKNANAMVSGMPVTYVTVTQVKFRGETSNQRTIIAKNLSE